MLVCITVSKLLYFCKVKKDFLKFWKSLYMVVVYKNEKVNGQVFHLIVNKSKEKIQSKSLQDYFHLTSPPNNT